VKEGLFERFPANEIYALHNWPGLPPGKLAVRAGPVMAATDEIQITVRGRGGHAAMPHLVVDPVVAASHIIAALQTIASRNVSPVDAVVVSIASMQTSQLGAFNVIPDSVRLVGTLRSFRRETRELVEKRVKEIATHVAQALGASAEIDLRRGYPPTINSEREAQFAARVGERIFGKANVVIDADPTMGGEDFAYMLLERPGAYAWLGQGGGPGGCFLHNPNYDFNDEVIPLAAVYAQTVAAVNELLRPLTQGSTVLEGREVKDSVTRLTDSVVRNPDALLLVSKLREKSAAAHARALQVSIYMIVFARFLELAREELELLGLLGLLQDVGKTQLPASIMEKQGPLTPEQAEFAKKHVALSAEILKATPG